MFISQSTTQAILAAAALLAATAAQAATVPFTEDFTSSNQGWKDAALADLTHVGTGGPDGGSYVTGSFSFASALENDTPILVRGQGSFDASGDAFVGNWISDGVTELTAWVRHDAPVPLNFFARIASPFNYPAAVALQFVPVMPNTWTKLVLDVSTSSTQLVTFEGSDYNTVFSNIGNVQFGVYVPAAMAGYAPSVTVDLDQPSITPEPASIALLSLGGTVLIRRR